MGLILDTGILIASERRGEAVEEILRHIRSSFGEIDIALSAVSVVELTHGIYRAKTDAQRQKRSAFAEAAFHDILVHPVSLEIAQLAGKIEGQQAALGIMIAFQDLVIGATALHLGFSVATLNTRHFKLIPELKIATL
jgi:predicted nucleic acid-binding protein